MLFTVYLHFCLVPFSFASIRPRQASTNSTAPKVKITIDTHIRYQTIDGFGASEAFQRARQIQKLSLDNQQKVLDLMFSTSTGAGFSILRNGIGSSLTYDKDFMKSIETVSPGSPSAQANYVWDGDDAGQVWLSKEAIKRGTKGIYANAWSAPGFMKTNGDDSNGGYICGVAETNCTSGDWRKAYAEYLIQYMRFYKEKEGIEITHLGFVNEPDLNQTYAAMQSSGFQASSFLEVLYPALRASEFKNVSIVCCETTGWADGADLLAELQYNPASEDQLDVYSAHGYSSDSSFALRTSKKVWQTEWADLDGRWNTAWDYLGKAGEGIAWANHIQQALVYGNVSGWLYWVGAETTTSNSALIRLVDGNATAEADISVSKRLWALAQFSRFVRPGAVRMDAQSSVGFVRVSAFLNKDGKLAVQAINNGHVDVDVSVEVKGKEERKESVETWVTNNEFDLEKVSSVNASRKGLLQAKIEKRSMVSFIF